MESGNVTSAELEQLKAEIRAMANSLKATKEENKKEVSKLMEKNEALHQQRRLKEHQMHLNSLQLVADSTAGNLGRVTEEFGKIIQQRDEFFCEKIETRDKAHAEIVGAMFTTLGDVLKGQQAMMLGQQQFMAEQREVTSALVLGQQNFIANQSEIIAGSIGRLEDISGTMNQVHCMYLNVNFCLFLILDKCTYAE